MKTDKMKKAYILVSPGFEILEAAAPVDVLERCSIEVEKVAVCGEMDGKIFGKTDLLIPSSHNVFIKADSFLSDMADVERIASDGAMVILPGGFPGYRNLSSNPLVGKLLQEFEKRGRLISEISRPLSYACGRVQSIYPDGVRLSLLCGFYFFRFIRYAEITLRDDQYRCDIRLHDQHADTVNKRRTEIRIFHAHDNQSLVDIRA